MIEFMLLSDGGVIIINNEGPTNSIRLSQEDLNRLISEYRDIYVKKR